MGAVLNSPHLVVLNRARTTFQRIGDAKFFNGWVKRITPETVVVHTCTGCLLNPGDEFSFQVYGNRKDAFFRAHLVMLQGAEVAPIFTSDRSGSLSALELGCHLTTSMTFKDCHHHPRYYVEGVTADVWNDESIREDGATVIDMGPEGFAAITSRQFRKHDRVHVALYASGHYVQCEAEVRNCVVNSLNIEFQRTGLQICSMDRVDALRWRQLYQEILEANKMQGALRTAELGTTVKRRARDVA